MNPIKFCISTILVLMMLSTLSCRKKREQVKILIFSKTSGYRHASISAGKNSLMQLAARKGIIADTTENQEDFHEENLEQYAAVIFLNTTGDILNHEQQNDFERYIQAGGGFVGIHSAADTEYNWPWYGNLNGAYFESHPSDPNVLKGKFRIINNQHPATSFLPAEWIREDEFYNFKNISKNINVLIDIDEKSYKGGTNGAYHPMAWYQEYDGGRAFYTNMGHTEETYSDSLFLEHVWGGIFYATGGDDARELDYSLAKTQRVPQENRFAISVLAEKLDEPMQLEILPDGKVIIIERKGNVKLFNPADSSTEIINHIPVCTVYNPVNGVSNDSEDGLLGIALDPDFEENRWVYLFYSPEGNKPENILARYEFRGDSLVTNTKKTILCVPVQRDECCHTGGSIAFDKDGNLYLSTGDNTSPRATSYSPIDERPGRSPWDAQKSSSNTNDLRGKILRIHPEPDGTYSIPSGNLFPEGTEKTRPEIFVMGVRNPYRITVDRKTGYLYWGDVGPDAAVYDSAKGPSGYDEINRTDKPGFFGWPYFTGNNEAYGHFDFEKESADKKFNPAAPLNKSPNNTGQSHLPPAQKALIYYGYSPSAEFPLTGSGGRTAMTGPVFYKDEFNKNRNGFPDYYDGKIFIYEWMRGWLMTVNADGRKQLQMEPFMPSHRFKTPVDMTFGKDGCLYMLEYGSGWFMGNDDARLIRVSYQTHNRAPVPVIHADRQTGKCPLTVNFTSAGTKDPDRDQFSIEWSTDGVLCQKGNAFTHIFTRPGIYKVRMKVTDEHNTTSVETIEIKAGNEIPEVSMQITEGNSTFFFPGKSVRYNIKVHDYEDGIIGNGIAEEQVSVSFLGLKEGYDRAFIAQGHNAADKKIQKPAGLKMMEESDCRACHSPENKSIGPSFAAISDKYKGQNAMLDVLAEKVIRGGKGSWGEIPMAAHPQITLRKAKEMVKYILHFNDKQDKGRKIGTRGILNFNEVTQEGIEAYMLRAAYSDKGSDILPSNLSEFSMIFRKPVLKALKSDFSHHTRTVKRNDYKEDLQSVLAPLSYIGYRSIDLTGIKAISVTNEQVKGKISGGTIEIRTGSSSGEVIGQSQEIKPGDANSVQKLKINIRSTSGKKDIYLIFRNEKAGKDTVMMIFKEIAFEM